MTPKQAIENALADVAKYRDLQYTVGVDRAALCHAAIVLADYVAALTGPVGEAEERRALEWFDDSDGITSRGHYDVENGKVLARAIRSSRAETAELKDQAVAYGKERDALGLRCFDAINETANVAKYATKLRQVLSIYANTDNWSVDSDDWIIWEGGIDMSKAYGDANGPALRALSLPVPHAVKRQEKL